LVGLDLTVYNLRDLDGPHLRIDRDLSYFDPGITRTAQVAGKFS
jgi:hypothetical protein